MHDFWFKATGQRTELQWKLEAQYFSLGSFTVVEPNSKIERPREKVPRTGVLA